MEPLDYSPPASQPEIIYRDEDIIVVAKPSGLLSVPGKHLDHKDCLELRLKAMVPGALLVHRLDMDTSGVMVFAATAGAQRHLGLQFEKRYVEKSYVALVWGQPEDEGTVTLPLIVDWPNRPLQKVCHLNGKSAETRWQVIARHKNYCRVRLTPKTGRSHQLRVHMKEIGHPILGDRFYSSGAALEAANRLCLHSHKLRLRHPRDGSWIEFEVDVPF